MYKQRPKIYKYKHRIFQVKGDTIIPLNKTGTKRKVSDSFYKLYKEWVKLPNREEYRIEL